MAKSNVLVIVESPAKAKTIKQYLGKDHHYEVLASFGHVRDLVPKKGAVDVEHDFAMRYEPIDRNKKHIQAIVQAAKKSQMLWLATDPDREGEAIAWHLLALLDAKGQTDHLQVARIVFHQITRSAIQEATRQPRELNMDLVNAQQARRALDYLVGFNLSPLLWKKITRGLSAGRVQSPALRMISEREAEIKAFVPQTYFTLHAACQHHDQPFDAKLIANQHGKVEQFTYTTSEAADAEVQALQAAAQGTLKVTDVEPKQRQRRPAPPFITSTLQQEASRKLGFSASRTMRVAQQLYEGITLDQGQTVGLITYMRTDSVHLAGEAVAALRDCIVETYGASDCPDKPQVYKTKSKNAQEAHEGIRPTDPFRRPEAMGAFLDNDQLKLYRLIWQRTIASQMIPAIMDTMRVDMACGDVGVFRVTGSTVRVPGFLKVYDVSTDDARQEDSSQRLPDFKVGDEVVAERIFSEEHVTEPPPRYSEASLVKALETHGIGRPSTYASIISTLLQRDYVRLEKKRFHPTDVGLTVNHFLTSYFNQYVDYGFTASLEDELDDIARGEGDWKALLTEFWSPFFEKVQDTETNVKRSDVTSEVLEEACPECQAPLVSRLGRRGRFIGCSAYPDCTYTRSLETAPEPVDTGVTCPTCKEHPILERRSRRGKVFYGCGGYPACSYAVWNPPLDQACPSCGWPMLTLKTTKRYGEQLVCPEKTCDYVASAPSNDDS